jgi:hypothetical protein
MEYEFKAKDYKELKAANSSMQQKAPGSTMCLYINTNNEAAKDRLKMKATEIASKNGYALTFLDKDPGNI